MIHISVGIWAEPVDRLQGTRPIRRCCRFPTANNSAQLVHRDLQVKFSALRGKHDQEEVETEIVYEDFSEQQKKATTGLKVPQHFRFSRVELHNAWSIRRSQSLESLLSGLLLLLRISVPADRFAPLAQIPRALCIDVLLSRVYRL